MLFILIETRTIPFTVEMTILQLCLQDAKFDNKNMEHLVRSEWVLSTFFIFFFFFKEQIPGELLLSATIILSIKLSMSRTMTMAARLFLTLKLVSIEIILSTCMDQIMMTLVFMMVFV